MSQTKSDPFDAQVLAAFLRTDHAHFTPLQPSSEAAQELKLLTHLERQFPRPSHRSIWDRRPVQPRN
jgi:hypothetical protein